MGFVYAIPGVVALIEWLLAAALYALGWYRARFSFNRVGDSLVLAGIVTSLAGVAWLTWNISPWLLLARSSLATGLAISALAIYAVLAYRRIERLSAFLILGFAIPAQAYAIGRLWWKIEAAPEEIFLPLWMAFRAATGLLGTGALGVSVAMIVLAFAFYRVRDHLPQERLLPGAAGLSALKWQSLRIALAALSVSLSFEVIRSWLGLGQVLRVGFVWSLITWLLVVAGAYGLMQGAIPRRAAHAILILAFAVAIGAALTMAG